MSDQNYFQRIKIGGRINSIERAGFAMIRQRKFKTGINISILLDYP